MKRMTLTIDGVDYPCTSTLGAMLYYKEYTGKEVSEVDIESPTEVVTFMWCLTRAACEREGVEMPWTLQQFANRLDADDLQQWVSAVVEQTGETKKKKQPMSRK